MYVVGLTRTSIYGSPCPLTALCCKAGKEKKNIEIIWKRKNEGELKNLLL